MSDNTDDSGAGCLVLIALAMITAGGCYLWGPVTLVIVGGIIITVLVIA